MTEVSAVHLQSSKPRHEARFFAAAIALCWALIIVGYPLTAATTTFFDLPNRVVSIGVRGATVALALGLIALVGLRAGRLQKGVFWAPLIVFWVWYLSRLAYDSAFMPENLRLTPFEYVLWAVGGALIPLLAFMNRFEDSDLDWALRVTLWLGAIACALIVAMLILNETGIPGGKRLRLATLNPISLGHLGLTVAILSAVSFLTSPRHWRASAVAYSVPLALGIVIALMAATRSVTLSLFLIWSLMLWFSGGKRSLAFGIVTVPAILAAAFLVQTYLGYAAISRIVGAAPGMDAAIIAEMEKRWPECKVETWSHKVATNLPFFEDPTRLRLLEQSGCVFSKRPLFGAGIEPLGYYPHNAIVESFLALGILGGIVFVAIVLMSTIAAWIVLKNDSKHYWIGLLFVQYMILAMLSGSLYGSGTTWCLMAAVIVRASQVSGSSRGSAIERVMLRLERLVPQKAPLTSITANS